MNRTVTAYRAAVATLLLALIAVSVAYYRQGKALAEANQRDEQTQYTCGALLRTLEWQAERTESAESRLKAIEKGVIIPAGTRKSVEQLRAAGQLAPEE